MGRGFADAGSMPATSTITEFQAFGNSRESALFGDFYFQNQENMFFRSIWVWRPCCKPRLNKNIGPLPTWSRC